MLSLGLAGCSVTGEGLRTAEFSGLQSPGVTHYAALTAEKFPVEAVDTSHIDPQFLQQVVDYRSPHPPGTVVVDPHRRFLYLVQKGGKAIRYGVGVGREGLAFAGTGTVQEKKEWPHWTPTAAMIARDPKRYAKWAAGMEGGPTTRSARGRSICSRTERTPATASTARPNPTASARPSRPAASA